MKKFLAIAVITAGITMVPVLASAQERIGDGLMGAGAGALVGGPVGAVAGGVIGYTSGPHISRGLGFHRHYRHQHYSYRNGHRVSAR
jgi:outer membrane lipoprotein SlyB